MARANYQGCVAFVRREEGGNTTLAGDTGGRTGRGGITWRVYDAYRARKGLPKKDVYQIADSEIAEIYDGEYWAPIHGNSLAAGYDLAVMDISVNSGPAKANRMRLAAANGSVSAQIQKICDDRLSFMHAIRGGSAWARFGKGWSARVARCEATALRMAGALTPAVVDKAKKDAAARKKKSGGAVVGGTATSGGMPEIFTTSSNWEIAAIIAVVVVAVGLYLLHTWRRSQRADILAQAVTDMHVAKAAADAAIVSASREATARTEAIKAEQARLAAAQADIALAASAAPKEPPK